MSLSTSSFRAVTDFFHRESGIRLNDTKRSLVTGRLQKLAQDRNMPSLDAYVAHVLSGVDAAEARKLIDKLTTNETYFFREPQHFDLLAELARKAPRSEPYRVWSAASSTGEEAYSVAMVLAEAFGPRGWEIVGTDLSSQVVESAQRGLFPLDRARDTPQALLKKYCLRGQGPHEGHVLVVKELRQHTHFRTANLMEALPDIGWFDVIFLRNVLIYFDPPAKVEIVRRVLTKLKPGGLLFTGHAESMGNTDAGLRTISAAVYERA